MAGSRPERRPSGDGASAYRLTVEYDGTRYAGFQVQPGQRTVAGELEAALGAALGRPVKVKGSGRTDAGVHAEGQVVSFAAAAGLDPRRLIEAMNDRLPADVCVLALAPAPSGFDARRSALSRTYRYQVSRRRDAFRKRLVWWVRSPLSLATLAAEAEAVLGFHDFASFTQSGTQSGTDAGTDAGGAETTTRVVAAGWTEVKDLLVFSITAERFLYRMVRRLVGVMVEVGLGRQEPGKVKALLEAPSPGATAATTAPPSGLFLESVDYPGALRQQRRPVQAARPAPSRERRGRRR